ncbi:LysR family transcriptional regulator [Streptomyces sp. NPDC056987]|uniref:LysR family transcriptional regulator n=1 Tax=Streptomyces sp. NPDC056987 TaxID=3345988 RepID=UPI00362EDDD9
MELRHLKYFVSVAESLNFTRAAARNFVAQSALSGQIAGLERELGVPLFHRNSRSVSLTEAGRVLLPLAQRILADVDIARMEVEALAGLRRGTLRLGLIQTPATSVDVIDVMGEFHRRHPGIEFAISDAPSGRMVAAVAAGTLDVAVVGMEASELPQGVESLPLAVEPLVAVVAADSPLAGRGLVGIPELVDGVQFIHFARESGLRRRVEAAFARAGIPPVGSFEMGQIHDMIRLAARGVAVTIVPHTDALEAERTGDTPFSVVPLADHDAVHPVSLVYMPARLSSAAAAFVEEFRIRPLPTPS